MLNVNRWVIAVIVVSCSVLIGRISGRIARSAFNAERHRPEVAEFGPSMGRVLQCASVAIGMLIAVAALDPDSFSALPDKALAIVPSTALAAVVACFGYAVSIAASAALATTAARTSGRRHRGAERLVRFSVMTMTAVVTLSLLGVNAAVLAVALAVAAGTPLLAAAVLTGIGGRDIARNLAAGRALRSHLRVGHLLCSGDNSGVIVNVNAVTVEIEQADGTTAHLPLQSLLAQPFSVNPLRGANRSGKR